ncbi:peptidase inhibitor I78 family-domain-containing protein [Aspergillus minisclerotigenes]|uniref:Peptidase inhibitor I78 family-domain-containing protein n=1 Tax=Aspergillus minisclerotigenes TaxID=656917 RepID=A0A5N6JIL3_9EURO|nr:peptidase inhibitor I78 family-domain-containing protein [Aspergillus minisclerotigenes]
MLFSSRVLLRSSILSNQHKLSLLSNKIFHSTMPLVVPQVNAGDKNEWLNKLAGKTITEGTSDVTSFAKKDLPQSHRIVKPGDMMTMDYKPERLNVHLDEQGTVHDVHFG